MTTANGGEGGGGDERSCKMEVKVVGDMKGVVNGGEGGGGDENSGEWR